MGQRSRTTALRPGRNPPARVEEPEEELDDEGYEGDDELDEDEEGGEYDDIPEPPLGDEDEDDIDVLNDPSVRMLPEPPTVGGRGRAMFMGQPIETVGQPSTPPLFAQASSFPDVRRFHVYKQDGTTGNPISIGTIAAGCSEEAFIRHFYHSMPRPGEGMATFIIHMINSSGKQVGASFDRPISDSHTTLRQLREEEKNMTANNGGGWGGVNVVGGDNGAGIQAVTEELGRVVEQAQEFQMQQLEAAKHETQEERRRALESERRLADERVELAKQSGTLQQSIMERMLSSDRARADEVRKTQADSSRFMLEMLTTMNAQTRESLMADAARRESEEKIRQERERAHFDRVLREERERRAQEAAAQEARWAREREEARAETERRAAEMKNQLEMQRMELENRRKEMEVESARRDRDFELKWKIAQDEREARDRRERTEREDRERQDRERFEREKKEEQERRDREKAEERDRREERERRDEARVAREREEAREREARMERERTREDERRREDLNLQIKRLEEERIREIARADRDANIAREHAQQMAATAAQEREALRLADERRLTSEREDRERRERAEREDREQRERDRQRAFDLEQARLAREAEQQREHQRSMIELQRIQSGGGGLEKFGEMFKTIGLDPTEGLKRIFASEEGVGETLMKGAAALAEGYLRSQQGRPASAPQASQTVRTVTIQTPEGPRVISEEAFRAMQARMAQLPASPPMGQIPMGTAPNFVPPLPPSAPTEARPASGGATPAPIPPLPPEPGPSAQETPADAASSEGPVDPHYAIAQQVNVLVRAREAGMPTAKARVARKKAKDLVKRLSEAEEAEWEAIVQAVMLTAPELFDYLNAVTVWAAVVDGGAPQELALRIVARLQEAEAAIRTDLGSAEPLLIFTEAERNTKLAVAAAIAAAEATAAATAPSESAPDAPVFDTPKGV